MQDRISGSAGKSSCSRSPRKNLLRYRIPTESTAGMRQVVAVNDGPRVDGCAPIFPGFSWPRRNTAIVAITVAQNADARDGFNPLELTSFERCWVLDPHFDRPDQCPHGLKPRRQHDAARPHRSATPVVRHSRDCAFATAGRRREDCRERIGAAGVCWCRRARCRRQEPSRKPGVAAALSAVAGSGCRDCGRRRPVAHSRHYAARGLVRWRRRAASVLWNYAIFRAGG